MSARRWLAAALALATLTTSTSSFAVPARELLARAVSAEARGDLAGSARAFEELVAAGVDDGDVLYDLGTVYARAERYGEAVWCLERVVRRWPFDLGARENLRATRVRLARRDAGRSGRAVVEHEPPFKVQLGELLPLDLSVPLVVMAELAVIGLWLWRRRARTEMQRVGTAAGMALAAMVGAFALTVVVARRTSPPAAIVLREGLRLGQSARVDAIPDAAVREGERVERLGRDGEFTRVRTLTGHSGWLRTRDLGALGP